VDTRCTDTRYKLNAAYLIESDLTLVTRSSTAKSPSICKLNVSTNSCPSALAKSSASHEKLLQCTFVPSEFSCRSRLKSKLRFKNWCQCRSIRIQDRVTIAGMCGNSLQQQQAQAAYSVYNFTMQSMLASRTSCIEQ
jgi:hypothetical protein